MRRGLFLQCRTPEYTNRRTAHLMVTLAFPE